jgi:hypothetical protein
MSLANRAALSAASLECQLTCADFFPDSHLDRPTETSYSVSWITRRAMSGAVIRSVLDESRTPVSESPKKISPTLDTDEVRV